MKLFNTLSRRIQEVEPQSSAEVGVYTCGPTVYDYPHIGNWFTFIRYDLLIRTLMASGYNPKWVLNVTDVGHLVSDADEGEDKLEKGARREGKSAWEIAEFYTDYFIQGLKRLNFVQPTQLPRATRHIAEQIELIKKLAEKGYTYRIDDGIYYDTSKFPKYAEFSRLDLDEQQTGLRIEPDPQKRNPSDFALWKFSPVEHQRDMEWDSPWGQGFPGWHIECSAMIHKYFGDTVDIHSGGIDHVPVHHSNEIAQSEAATGKPLALHWMHTNHILIDDQKIAKSKGNGITLEDIESRGYSLRAFRLLVLQSHYRSQSKFSWDELAAAQNRLLSIQGFADLRFQMIDPTEYEISGLDYGQYLGVIVKALQNDLSTPRALEILSFVVDRHVNPVLKDESQDFIQFLDKLDDLFGLDLLSSEDITSDQKKMIAGRESARSSKDWQKADRIRTELLEEGVELNDTPYGPLWRRS